MYHVSRLELTSSGLIIYKRTRFFRFFCSLEGEEPCLWLHQKCFQRPAVLHSSLKFTQLPHIPEHRNRHTFHKIYLHQSDLNWCYSSKTKFLSNVSSQSKLNLQHQSPILRSQVSFKIHAASARWAEVYSLRFIFPFLRKMCMAFPILPPEDISQLSCSQKSAGWALSQVLWKNSQQPLVKQGQMVEGKWAKP